MSDKPQIKTGRPAEGGHWYTSTGEMVHEVLKADGKGYRAPNVTDAKKYSWVPGVTTKLSVLPAPQLVNWQIENAASGVVEYLILRGGLEGATKEGVIKATWDHLAELASAAPGTAVHKAIEQALGGEVYNPDMIAWVEVLMAELERLEVSDRHPERAYVNNEQGYGCRVDLWGRTGDPTAVFDFKTKKSTEVVKSLEAVAKGNKPSLGFDKDVAQLAANGEAIIINEHTEGKRPIRYFNIFIGREPLSDGSIPLYTREWNLQEIERGWRIFCKCSALWDELKGFNRA